MKKLSVLKQKILKIKNHTYKKQRVLEQLWKVHTEQKDGGGRERGREREIGLVVMETNEKQRSGQRS